jgi:hypothetical protein
MKGEREMMRWKKMRGEIKRWRGKKKRKIDKRRG